MSRWTENFENHAFQDSWKEVTDAINELVPSEDTTDTGVLEIARLKKVANLINQFLESCDPEIIPDPVWNDFHTHLANCIAQLNNYSKNNDGAYIRKTNTHMDHLLALISPYQALSKGAAKAANTAFKKYASSIEESLSIFQDKARKTTAEIESLKLSSEENANECEENCIAINQLKEKLLDDSETESVNTAINNFAAQIQQRYNEITALHEKIFDGDSTSHSIESEIFDALRKSKEESEEIEELLEAITKETKNYKNYHEEVFGTPNDEGELEGGLKQEIETRRKNLDDFKKQQEEK